VCGRVDRAEAGSLGLITTRFAMGKSNKATYQTSQSVSSRARPRGSTCLLALLVRAWSYGQAALDSSFWLAVREWQRDAETLTRGVRITTQRNAQW
jgi:hypothetical protein